MDRRGAGRLDDRLLVVRGAGGTGRDTASGAAAGDGSATGDWTATETLAGPAEFYALTNRGLFGSGDAARSWRALGVAWPAAHESRLGRGLAVVG